MTTVPSHAPVIGNWGPYYEAVCRREPSYLAKIAIQHVDFRGSFLDVGSGTFNDARFALSEGFHRVEALDGSFHSPIYANELKDEFRSRFQFTNSLFCDFDFGESRFHWIHSNFSLPYFGPRGFDDFILRIKTGVSDSGLISATFFGYNDEWRNMHRDFAFLTKSEIESMFADFKIILLTEHETDGHFYDRTPKHWHYFRLIARKSDSSL